MEATNVSKFNTEANSIVLVSVKAVPQIHELANRDAITNLQVLIQPNIDAALAVAVRDDESREAAFFWARTIKPFSAKLDKARREINRVLKSEVDGRFQPTIDKINEALHNAQSQIKAYDEEQRLKAVKVQREADEAQRKAEKELARRQAIQDAAVAAGKTAQKEIPKEVEREEIALPSTVAQDTRQHYRVRYEIKDESLLPDEFVIRTPNKGEINKMALVLEGGIAKDRKGIDEIPQEVAGVRFYWESVLRTG